MVNLHILYNVVARPNRNDWCLPGGFANYNEPTSDTALREFEEETGTKLKDQSTLKFLCVADGVDRDPRQRTISIVYWAVADMDPNTETISPLDTEEIAEHRWVALEKILDGTIPLAFDHAELVRLALLRKDS